MVKREPGFLHPKSTRLPPQRVIDRLLANFHVRDDGCWISGYSVASHGYSQIGWIEGPERHMWLGHRVSWAALHGPIRYGYTIDHLCRDRQCINPEHLRELSNWENGRLNRDTGFTDPKLCVNGHSDKPVWGKDHGRDSLICPRCAKNRQKRKN